MTKSSWNKNSYLNIKLEEQLSLKANIFLTYLKELYFVKMSPIFNGSSSNCLTRYKQILSGCSFVTKTLLNINWLAMKTNNHCHISARCPLPQYITQSKLPLQILIRNNVALGRIGMSFIFGIHFSLCLLSKCRFING